MRRGAGAGLTIRPEACTAFEKQRFMGPYAFDSGRVAAYYTRPMSPAPADLVNTVELAGRSACVEREVELQQLEALREAGALVGTRAHARLQFATFEGRPTIEVVVEGQVVLPCQRCLEPCTCAIEESAQLVVVDDDSATVPGGFEPYVADPERLSLTELIEEQLLLGLPLIARHADRSACAAATGLEAPATDAPGQDKQRPFEGLRGLLGDDES